MKKEIRKIIDLLGKNKFIKQYYKGKGMILTLHRIAPFENKINANENMKVTPQFLESFILDCKHRGGYQFISLDELYNGLINGSLINNFICITIDDGYIDNLQYAYPIFVKHKIPFCIYLCTSFPENQHDMWWYALEDYLLNNNHIYISGKKVDISNINMKENIFLKIREIIINKATYKINFSDILKTFGIEYNARIYNKLALRWDDLKYMLSQTTLCTIGCHTHSHYVFNGLSNKEVYDDILKSKELFNKYLGFEPKHFAYPFGSKVEVDKKFFPLIKKLGFKTATTTRFGPIYPEHKNYLMHLPRVFFGENFMLESVSRVRRKKIIND